MPTTYRVTRSLYGLFNAISDETNLLTALHICAKHMKELYFEEPSARVNVVGSGNVVALFNDNEQPSFYPLNDY